MLILAADTSSVTASCALYRDGFTVAESFLDAKITHSATVMPMIENLFSVSGTDIDEVTMFAATTGPGSFTGVRICTSIILGLANGKNVPCVGVSTFEVLAAAFDKPLFKDFIVCPVMDARRSQFYNALFKDGKRLTEDRAISAELLRNELINQSRPVIFCGDGHKLAKELMPDVETVDVPKALLYPSASYAASVAYDKYENSADKSVFTDLNFKPVYLRPSQAEITSSEKGDNK